MRAAWLIVFVCTTAAADDGWRYQSRADGHRMTNDKIDVPPDPPLPAFAMAGTFYVMAVDASARPRCDAWTVDPAAKTFTGPTAKLALGSDGTHLALGDRCAEWINVSETADGVDVNGSTWFRDRSACMQAIVKHRPVATDLDGCVPPPPERPGPQIRATLDRVLSRGGTLFAVVDDSSDDNAQPATCEPVRADGASFHHVLTSEDWDGHPLRGETTWQYYYTVGDDQFSVMDGTTHWPDGHGFGTLCGHDQRIQLGPDWADLGERYYFSAPACRAAIAKERQLASWFARRATGHSRGVGFGGC